jgi:2-hydroxychromene-2-carboxylate isomerase
MVVYGTGPFGSDPEGPALFWGQDRLGFVERALGGTPDESPAVTAGPPVDVWFDYSSPFSYLGATRAKRFLGDRVRWRPMLLGALFRELGGPDVPLATFNSAKQAWIAADLRWQAAEAGVALNWPSRFPVRTVLALRVTLLALEQDAVAAEQLIGLLYRSVWVMNEDPADPKVVLACCEEAGLDGASLLEMAGQPAGKQALFTATAAALGAGVFGAPTFVVDPDGELPGLFWGNDRLPLAAANC